MRHFLLAVAVAAYSVQAVAQRIPASLDLALRGGPSRYAGTRTVKFNRPIGMRSHVEYISHLDDKSRVDFAKGCPLEGQIIIEDYRLRQQYFPRRNEIETAPPRNELAAGRMRGFVKKVLRGRWQIGTETGGSVAGIATELVYFKDPRNLVRERLWIDPQNGMVLRRMVYGGRGEEIAGFEYTQIDYNPSLSANLFLLNTLGVRIVTPEVKAQRLAIRNGFASLELPASSGYKLESSQIIRVAGNPAFNEVYSGPKGKFSLFRLRSVIDPEKLSSLARGSFRVKTWVRNGETFALVGDIDEESLDEVARQLGRQ